MDINQILVYGQAVLFLVVISIIIGFIAGAILGAINKKINTRKAFFWVFGFALIIQVIIVFFFDL